MPRYKIELEIEHRDSYVSLLQFLMARPDMYCRMITHDPVCAGYVVPGTNHRLNKENNK